MTSNEQQIILNAFQAAEMSREEEDRFLKLWKPIAFNRLYTPPLGHPIHSSWQEFESHLKIKWRGSIASHRV